MSEIDLITSISSAGGVLAFAVVVWRSIEKLSARLDSVAEAVKDDAKETRMLLSAMVERLARLDERTSGIEREEPTRPGRRAQTRPRGQPITPFVPTGLKKEDDDG